MSYPYRKKIQPAKRDWIPTDNMPPGDTELVIKQIAKKLVPYCENALRLMWTKKKPEFPPPAKKLGNTPGWYASQINAWCQHNGVTVIKEGE